MRELSLVCNIVISIIQMILLILSSEVLRYEMSSFANFDVEELLLLLKLRVDLWEILNTYVTDQPSPSS